MKVLGTTGLALMLTAVSLAQSPSFVGGEFQVDSDITFFNVRTRISSDPGGSFVTVWDDNYRRIGARRFQADGTPIGSEFQVNTDNVTYKSYASIDHGPNGDFVVVWASTEQKGEVGAAGIFGQRYNSRGRPRGSEFQINTDTFFSQGSPEVAVDSAGNFVVVWQDNVQDGSYSGVFARRYDAAGVPQDDEFQVNTYTGYQVGPRASMDAAGNFAVAWDDFEQDGSSYGIFGRQFDSLGTPLGPEFQVSSYTTDNQDSPAVAAHGSGALVVVWKSNHQDGSYDGVFGQQFEVPVFVACDCPDLSDWSSVFPPPGP